MDDLQLLVRRRIWVPQAIASHHQMKGLVVPETMHSGSHNTSPSKYNNTFNTTSCWYRGTYCSWQMGNTTCGREAARVTFSHHKHSVEAKQSYKACAYTINADPILRPTDIQCDRLGPHIYRSNCAACARLPNTSLPQLGGFSSRPPVPD